MSAGAATALVGAREMSVLRSGLAVAADAVGITTIRAAYSTTIKGGADVSSGLFDTRGRLIALSDTSMIGHLAPLRCAVRSILEDFPVATIEPGDVFIMNDPYRGGVHANDMQVFSCVFVEGRLQYLTGAMVHVADVGGSAPGGLSGTVTDLFQEGLTLPPVRLYRAGVPVRDTFNVIGANTRTPEITLGDVRALTAGTKAGQRELLALVERLGPDGPALLASGIDALFEYTEQRTRGRVAELGDGSAAGQAVIDDDGVRVDVPLTVRARITIDGDRMAIDFTGTDPQATGPINAPEGPAVSAALYGAMILLDDPEIPVNEGMFAALDIIRPEGSLVAPRRPGAANARGIVMLAMIDAMIDAMAQLHPSRAIAGCDLNHVLTLSSTDEHGRTRSFHDRDYGGAGARHGHKGVDAHGYAVFAGRSNVVPVEYVEREHAVLFLRHALRRGSEGPGRWPGGRGVVKEFRVLRDSNLTVRTDKFKFPPRGIAGGGDGVPGAWILNLGTGDERHLRSKETNLPLRAGETLTMLTPGGGGFGVPGAQGAGGSGAGLDPGVGAGPGERSTNSGHGPGEASEANR